MTENELKEIFNTAVKKCVSMDLLKNLVAKTQQEINSTAIFSVVSHLYEKYENSNTKSSSGKCKADFGLWLNLEIQK